jgi:hypothetical protein
MSGKTEKWLKSIIYAKFKTCIKNFQFIKKKIHSLIDRKEKLLDKDFKSLNKLMRKEFTTV